MQDKNSLDYTDYDHDDDHNLVFYEPEGGDDGGESSEFWVDEQLDLLRIHSYFR